MMASAIRTPAKEQFMTEPIELSATDLAAMLCSRVCHDLINPIGAIGLGVEMLDDPSQAENWKEAGSLIANSARHAEARLQFARLAYGSSSTQGTEIETRECEKVALGMFAVEKADLDWQVPMVMLPKLKAKLLMNMLQIASSSVPRGGVVTVKMDGEPGHENFRFTSRCDPDPALRQKTLVPSGAADLIGGSPEEGVDARGIQPFYTGLLARMTGMELEIGLENDEFFFTAISKAS
jgi:histidine phosphotransferase ChpT